MSTLEHVKFTHGNTITWRQVEGTETSFCSFAVIVEVGKKRIAAGTLEIETEGFGVAKLVKATYSGREDQGIGGREFTFAENVGLGDEEDMYKCIADLLNAIEESFNASLKKQLEKQLYEEAVQVFKDHGVPVYGGFYVIGH